MMRSMLLVLGASLAATVVVAQAPTARAELELVAQDGTRQVLSRDSLAKLPQEEIRGRMHDGPERVFRGPTVATVVALTGIPTDRVRGKALRLVVFAQARDDYAVAYSLGELSPGLSGRRAILALSQDGAPLDDETGPLRIVVEGDLHGARWIRQLSRLSVLQVGTP